MRLIFQNFQFIILLEHSWKFLTHIAAYHHLSLKFDQGVEPYDCKYLICLVLAKHSKLKSADWLYDYFLRALRLTRVRYWMQWRFRTYSLFTCSRHYWNQISLSSGTSKKNLARASTHVYWFLRFLVKDHNRRIVFLSARVKVFEVLQSEIKPLKKETSLIAVVAPKTRDGN